MLASRKCLHFSVTKTLRQLILIKLIHSLYSWYSVCVSIFLAHLKIYHYMLFKKMLCYGIYFILFIQL